jgi:hypothetical protein
MVGPGRSSLYLRRLVKCMASVLSASSRRSSRRRLSLSVLNTTDNTAALCNHASLEVALLQNVIMRLSST